MTGLLIVGAMIALLVLALEPAHRRLGRQVSPLAKAQVVDRDRERLTAELRARTPERQLKTRRRLPVLHVRRHPAV